MWKDRFQLVWYCVILVFIQYNPAGLIYDVSSKAQIAWRRKGNYTRNNIAEAPTKLTRLCLRGFLRSKWGNYQEKRKRRTDKWKGIAKRITYKGSRVLWRLLYQYLWDSLDCLFSTYTQRLLNTETTIWIFCYMKEDWTIKW